MTRPSTPWIRALATVLVAALPASAQNGTQWAGRHLFVDAINGVDNPYPIGGSFAAPFRTAAFAVSEAVLANATPFFGPKPTTINLRAGLYSPTSNGDSFPLEIPTTGFKLEAFEPNVVVDAGGQPWEVIRVVNYDPHPAPDVTFPHTVIRGLDIRNGGMGVTITTDGAYGRPASETTRVTVRDCLIHENMGMSTGGTGILITTASGYRSEHVLEQNHIFFHSHIGSIGRNIRIQATGTDSTVVRANEISSAEVGLEVLAPFGVARPRVFSNFFIHHEAHVFTHEAGPILIHNTMVAATPYSGSGSATCAVNHNSAAGAGQDEVVPATPTQMNGSKTLCVIRNCILWNPSGTGFSAPELRGNGPFCVGYSDLEEAGAATNVFWRGGNVVPAGMPAFVSYPSDPHLVQPVGGSSGLIETAERQYELPGVTVSVNGVPVPLDVSIDVDGDCRILDHDKNASVPDAQPDRGADEVLSSVNGYVGPRLAGSAGVDQYGNVHRTTGTGNWDYTLSITTRPFDYVLLYVFFTTSTGPYDMNFVNTFQNPLGDLLLPFSSDTVQAASGLVPASGTWTQNFSIPAGMPNMLEAELYYQGGSLILGGSLGDFTNRLRVEFNE